jgi:hypothetical protein
VRTILSNFKQTKEAPARNNRTDAFKLWENSRNHLPEYSTSAGADWVGISWNWGSGFSLGASASPVQQQEADTSAIAAAASAKTMRVMDEGKAIGLNRRMASLDKDFSSPLGKIKHPACA